MDNQSNIDYYLSLIDHAQLLYMRNVSSTLGLSTEYRMPTTSEIQHRQNDAKRVNAELAKAAAAKKVVLKKHLAELSQQKSDLNRQISETSRELGSLG